MNDSKRVRAWYDGFMFPFVQQITHADGTTEVTLLGDSPSHLNLKNHRFSPDSEKPLEVMEYLGKQDANGQEICEGDIVGYQEDPVYGVSPRGIVRFGTVDLGCNGFEYHYVIHGFYVELNGSGDEGMTKDMLEGKLIVLGNIWEHPHLLQKAQGHE